MRAPLGVVRAVWVHAASLTSPDTMSGAVAAAVIGLGIKAARTLFRTSADKRAHVVIKNSLRGEFAEFENRLLERLGQEFARASHVHDRFAALERVIAAESSARVDLAKDLRALRIELAGRRDA